MRSKLRLVLLIASSLALLVGCSSRKPKPVGRIPAFAQETAVASATTVNKIRQEALRDTATRVAAQGALAFRSKELNKILTQQKRSLDQVFDFRPLLLKENVLPPVLSYGDRTLTMEDPEALRLADKVYRLEQPPRFITAPPLWEDYLRMNFSKPEKPDDSLLPHDEKERELWNNYVAVGWKQGLEQANDIFNTNLARLKRDYEGMLLYRQLLVQNIVSEPFVAQADLGVTGNANELRVNDRVLRITATSKLNPNSKEWQAVITEPRHEPTDE